MHSIGFVILIGIISLFINGLNLALILRGTIFHLRLEEGYRMEEVREFWHPLG